MHIDAAELTQAHIDAEKEGCAHVLVSIGFLGNQRVYMDLDLETIRARYAEEEGDDMNDYMAVVMGFDDTFRTYDLRE